MIKKYVAFLDILGFKERLTKLSQIEAEEFISSFSRMLYEIWENKRLHINKDISGYIVSDSIIVYTKNDEKSALNAMVDYIIEVCKCAFSKYSVLLRCGIAKGDFNYLDSYSFDNLKKGLIVGQAYVDAYLLESKKKASVIIIDDVVFDDIKRNTTFKIEKINNQNEKEYAIIKWGNVDFLLEDNNLNKFVELAQSSNWLPHYYNTIYLFLSKDSKQDLVFERIIDIIKNKFNKQSYRDINTFIENAFSNDVERHFKEMMLKYIRNKL